MPELTKPQLDIIRAYLAQVRDRAKWQPEELYSPMTICVSKSLMNLAVAYGFTAADIQMAIWWYQFRHKPGSKEWRPRFILPALVRASERDYVEPDGKIEADDRILLATPRQKQRARMMFIRQFGFETFREKVKPIMRRHGVKALFNAPATSEIRGYVEILAGLANKTL